jgi:hypothetical protein
MRYKFIGDCHGKVDRLLGHLKRSEDLKIIQLGDMGLGFRGVELPNLHHDFGFIRGNHDAPDLCRMHSNYIGDFGLWHGVFCIGGAYSIDWKWREPGKSWWPDEELSEQQLDRCLELYCQVKPRIVASHEAPQSIGEMLLKDVGFRPERWGSTESRTAKMLQRMLNHHQPEHWYFGHYHRNWAVALGGTHFQCLGELSVALL